MQQPSPYGYTPTSRTQPYRKNGLRPPGAALSAMLAGQPMHLPNPMDAQRQLMQGPSPVEGSLSWHLSRLNKNYSLR